MATVRVVLRKCRKLKDGRYPIAIRLTHNNNQLIKLEQAEKPFTVYDLHSKSTKQQYPTTLFKFAESYYPFSRNKYTIPTGPTQKRAISKEAIIKIEELELDQDSYLWHARNYFLFSFYTLGMNLSDMAHLKNEK
jgi:hypothetical protein